MKKIVIIGGGFAGISALIVLRRLKKDLAIILVDKKTDAHVLPLLPDVIGRGIDPQFLKFNLGTLCMKKGCTFINDEVVHIDFDKNIVSSANQSIDYDYLVVATGSETNFYGNGQIEKHAYKLDTADDAAKIVTVLRDKRYDSFIIAGGGYTGVEIASNLRRYLRKKKVYKNIVIVERAASLLGPLPAWMKEYVGENLNKLSIEILLNCTIEKAEEEKIHLSNGTTLTNAMLIWSAGVKTNDFVKSDQAVKDRQGRINVDAYLRLCRNCFVIGDAARFCGKERCLRMAVQFSIFEGEKAAENIVRDMCGAPLKAYRPIDLGYIIPMANNSSCGVVLGCPMKGLLPTLFHYTMCVYRAYGFRNKVGILQSLITGGVR